MRSFPLLILLLVTGCEASTQVEGCRRGWVSFTCHYPEPKDYKEILFTNPEKKKIIAQENSWQKEERYSIYHDTKRENVVVVIKNLRSEDEGNYRCEFKSDKPVDLNLVVKDCEQRFTQLAYKGAKATISCHHGSFLCKQKENFCQRVPIQDDNPTWVYNRTNPDDSGFNVSISDITKEDAGRYWCERESQNELQSRSGIKRIELKVEDITTLARSAKIGEDFSYWCGYRERNGDVKFICKGNDPSTCEKLANTTGSGTKYVLDEVPVKRNITITIRNVAAEDSGTYWCGAESNDPTQSDEFFNKLFLRAVSLELDEPSSGPPETESPSTTAESDFPNDTTDVPSERGSRKLMWGVVAVCLLLLFGLFLLLVYKRVSKSPTTKSEGQKSKDERLYEDVHELSQQPPAPADAPSHIYSTASTPSHVQPDLLHYATVDFKSHADTDLIPRPSPSACEYSTLRTSRAPESS